MESLSAENYIYSSDIYKSEFETVFSKVFHCFNMLLGDKVPLLKDENRIRNTLLLNYLKNDIIRHKVGLLEFNFEREVPEDHSIGRTDIKITTLKTFLRQKEYYTIECKLLDHLNLRGLTGLNAKYVANGICRFTSGYYHTSSETVNGMIGFVVSEMDIDKNIENINYLQAIELKNNDGVVVQSNTTKFLTRSTFIDKFDYQYVSEHKKNDGCSVKLYHLMLDCTKNITSGTTPLIL